IGRCRISRDSLRDATYFAPPCTFERKSFSSLFEIRGEREDNPLDARNTPPVAPTSDDRSGRDREARAPSRRERGGGRRRPRRRYPGVTPRTEEAGSSQDGTATEEAGRHQERGNQRLAGEPRQSSQPIPRRYLHHPRRCQMAVDPLRLCSELPLQLVGVRGRVVVHRVLARRHGTGSSRRRELEALRRLHPRLHLLLPLQFGDAAHDRIRVSPHHRKMPRGRRHLVPSVDRRSHDPGHDGRSGFHEAVPTEEESRDAALLAARGHLPSERAVGPRIPGRRHADTLAHRSEHGESPIHPSSGDAGGRGRHVRTDGAEPGRRPARGPVVLHLAGGRRAHHRPIQPLLRTQRFGSPQGSLRTRRDSRWDHRVDGPDHPGPIVLPPQRDTLGTPISADGHLRPGVRVLYRRLSGLR
ncbi:unnamed protein product, partial [Darwinula stevensoni]